jgi:hypothetical protein
MGFQGPVDRAMTAPAFMVPAGLVAVRSACWVGFFRAELELQSASGQIAMDRFRLLFGSFSAGMELDTLRQHRQHRLCN